VLVGYSSGGLVTHAVARRLAEAGAAPAGIVLLDSYSPEDRDLLAGFLPEIAAGLVARSGQLDGGEAADSWGEAWLTAMGRYVGLDWTPAETSVPTLLVRASSPLAGWAEDGDWRAAWKMAHAVVDVPGDHFTMMEDHAATTAMAVDRWLREPR
jgi:thioesterase domain-containing protein